MCPRARCCWARPPRNTFTKATLYYTGSDGVSLSQATRTLLVQTGETLLDVVLEALLDSSLSPAQVSVIPGDTRVISREISGGLVTVNLSIEARNVQSDQELLLIYLGHFRNAAGNGGR